MAANDIDDYLGAVPEPQRTTLQVVRERLRAELPDAEEVMTYGVPGFAVGGKAVAGYAAAKKHCSYFPMSGSVLAGMSDALNGYDWSKGTLRFAVDEPLPQSLIRALVKARSAELQR